MIYRRTLGSTDNTIFVYLLDSTTNQPKTGVTYDEVSVSMIRGLGVPEVIPSMVSITAFSPHTDGGWLGLNIPGLYRLDLPDSKFISGTEFLVCVTATGAYMREPITVLLEYDHQAATDDVIDEITSLGAALPSESFIDAKHVNTINEIRGVDNKTISDANSEIQLAQQSSTATVVNEITSLGEALPSESFISAEHVNTISEIRGVNDKTNSDVFTVASDANTGIANLAATLPDESYIDAKHTDTIDQIRGAGDKTISDAHAEASLARKCVGNSRQVVVATGEETVFDDDGVTPIREITRSEPVTGTLREEANTPA